MGFFSRKKDSDITMTFAIRQDGAIAVEVGFPSRDFENEQEEQGALRQIVGLHRALRSGGVDSLIRMAILRDGHEAGLDELAEAAARHIHPSGRDKRSPLVPPDQAFRYMPNGVPEGLNNG